MMFCLGDKIRGVVTQTLLVLAMCTIAPAYGAESTPVITSHTRASLVSEQDVLPPAPSSASSAATSAAIEGSSLRVGLRLQLQPGWHTYWQNPGDAGDAPHVHITVTGVRTGATDSIEWPVPERVSEGGLMSYAYLGDVLLPLRVPLHGQGEGKLTVTAQADWLVCADVCVPETGHFTLDIPVHSLKGDNAEAIEAPLFRRADAQMPQPSPFTAVVSPDGVLQLRGDGLSSETIKQAWFFPQEGGIIAQNAPQALEVTAGQLALHLKPDTYSHPPFWQKALAGVVVLVDGAGNHSAVQIVASPSAQISPPSGAQAHHVEPQAELPAASSSEGAYNVWQVAFFALLGGMILNLMPCVFPVLAMKILSLAQMGGASWRVRGRSALFYSAGVMGCFAILGGAMMALRYGGAAVGWGFQFQSTGFVVSVGWLLFVMALNLLGVFQITGGRLAGRAGQAASGHGVGSDVMAGLLAVIVATPCTAPFMGTAIASALAGPVWAGLCVFLSMGLGLAAPYVALAMVPTFARYMPRPGLWMERLKQILAFPLLATCVWLLWVAVLQRGGSAVVLMAGGSVLLGLGSWLYGLAQQRAIMGDAPVLVWLGRGGAILCVLLCVVGLVHMVNTPDDTAVAAEGQKGNSPQTSAHNQGAVVEPFSQERLDALRAAGRPVFVDMTASWCVTCLVNQRVALDVPSVQAAFQQHGVTILRGDWTRRDERITVFLKAHGRDGVPLYIYYPPHQEGRILPQILTPNLVINAL